MPRSTRAAEIRYDALHRPGAVILGSRAIELALAASCGKSVLEHPSKVPSATRRTAQDRAARLAGVRADERRRHAVRAMRAA